MFENVEICHCVELNSGCFLIFEGNMRLCSNFTFQMTYEMSMHQSSKVLVLSYLAGFRRKKLWGAVRYSKWASHLELLRVR